jgi:hypothetical protein
MKTFIYALAVAATLSATPAFAGYGSATAADTATPSNSASDEANAPIAAQLQDVQHGVGPSFGDDERVTPPAQESGMRIAPYPDSERLPFGN